MFWWSLDTWGKDNMRLHTFMMKHIVKPIKQSLSREWSTYLKPRHASLWTYPQKMRIRFIFGNNWNDATLCLTKPNHTKPNQTKPIHRKWGAGLYLETKLKRCHPMSDFDSLAVASGPLGCLHLQRVEAGIKSPFFNILTFDSGKG